MKTKSKKRRLSLLFIPLFLNNVSCSSQKLATFFVVSDIHYLSNLLVLENQKEKLCNDGRCQELDDELLDALILKINKEKPSFLFISGDLTFNGEKASHLDLINKLKQINKETKVLVIPGNHDCYNVNAYSYTSEYKEHVDGIDYEEFRSLYQDFGYLNAISYSSVGNSYAYKLNDSYLALMIDSTYSLYNYEYDSNIIGGYLFDDELEYIKDTLEYAKNNNLKVISFMHHNLMDHNPLFTSSYTVNGNEKLLELFKKYNVLVNFSGHLHIQSIKESDGIYDIASASLLDYGNNIGIIDVYDDCLKYKTNKLSIKGMNLQEYSFNTFVNKYKNKSALNEDLYQDKANDVLDFISKINAYYFDGDYKAINKLKKKYKTITNLINEKNTSKYVSELLNVENKNQNEIVVKY